MAHKHDDSGETQEQRLNRQLDQLLQELRIAMPARDDVLFGPATVAVTVIVSAAVSIGLWFVLGTLRRMSKDPDGPRETART